MNVPLAAKGVTSQATMMTPDLLSGAVYAAALGAGLGVSHVVGGAGLAEHFGTRHLGNLRGITSMVGIFGAATCPIPFATSPPQVGYVILLGSIAAAMVLGVMAAPRPFLRAEAAKL